VLKCLRKEGGGVSKATDFVLRNGRMIPNIETKHVLSQRRSLAPLGTFATYNKSHAIRYA